MDTTRGFRPSGLKHVLSLLFAAVAVAGPAAAAGPADGPFTEESKLDKAQAGFDRIKIGKLDVTALSDGSGGFLVLNVADAARNGYFVALDHMYFPGIGRLREESAGYRWLPIPYVNDAKKR